MGFKAVVFDLDGTLLDSLAEIAASMNSVLARMKYPMHPADSYRVFVGDGMDILARRVLPQDQVNDTNVAEMVKLMREEYATRWNLSKAYAGVPELLDALTQRGVRRAVLSNKPDDFTKTIMRELFGNWTFDVVLGSRPNVPKKPDPAGAVELAQMLKLAPDECLYVGDTNTDMWTATRAEMYALGALWGFRSAEELAASGARALLREPLDVLKFL